MELFEENLMCLEKGGGWKWKGAAVSLPCCPVELIPGITLLLSNYSNIFVGFFGYLF